MCTTLMPFWFSIVIRDSILHVCVFKVDVFNIKNMDSAKGAMRYLLSGSTILKSSCLKSV